ncbi:MAG: hypothetical protein WC757_02265 [Candidatus Paceibacterota bacterium]|jgi:hypothetical protein
MRIKFIIILCVLGMLMLACTFFVFWPQVSGMFVVKEKLENTVCTMDAKICPDGSAVGRSGPSCEFAACPEASAVTAGDITLGIGQKALVGAVNVTLNAIVQDSRCPVDVQCIQAGTVTANITLNTGAFSETRSISSNERPYLFNGHYISIASVTPMRYSEREISLSAYYITFHIEKMK